MPVHAAVDLHHRFAYWTETRTCGVRKLTTGPHALSKIKVEEAAGPAARETEASSPRPSFHSLPRSLQQSRHRLTRLLSRNRAGAVGAVHEYSLIKPEDVFVSAGNPPR